MMLFGEPGNSPIVFNKFGKDQLQFFQPGLGLRNRNFKTDMRLLLLNFVFLVSMSRSDDQPIDGACEFGTVPGYWFNTTYKSFSEECQFQRLVDQHSPEQVKKYPAFHGDFNKTHVLFIGDSLDRNVVMGLSEFSGVPFRDYTPVRWMDDGRPQKIGRCLLVEFANYTYSNLFIFAANNKKKYYNLWQEGVVKGMSNFTHERICRDGPKFLPYFPEYSPYLISVNSAYWEVAWWRPKYGRDGRQVISLSSEPYAKRPVSKIIQSFNVSLPLKSGELPTRAHASSIRLGRPAFEGMVMRHPKQRSEPNYMEQLLDRFRDDIEGLMDKVEECFPNAEVYCWRTAPRVATDDRIHHYFNKRPHVMAALNQLSRYAAKKRGWCVLDMDFMLQGYGNDEAFVPDGAHPAPWVNVEYANIILNVIEEHKKRWSGRKRAGRSNREGKDSVNRRSSPFSLLRSMFRFS
mmetsp:Transcript_36010/g.85418  ORF Transcript_36010/g.85418 Transcript_36010/m.85418 type:complete len:460 (-) Transcript_36010:2459-3838(-)